MKIKVLCSEILPFPVLGIQVQILLEQELDPDHISCHLEQADLCKLGHLIHRITKHSIQHRLHHLVAHSPA